MENDNVKFNLIRLKNIIIQNKYNKKLDLKNNDNDIINHMNNYVDNLKQIDLIYTLSDIESIKYGNTSYPNTLYNDALINKLCFLNIILGFIDGNIEFLNYNDYINSYILIKNKVLNDFKDSVVCYNLNIEIKTNILNSYIIGYMNYNKYDLYSVYKEYLKLFKELNEYEQENRRKFEKIKKKVK